MLRCTLRLEQRRFNVGFGLFAIGHAVGDENGDVGGVGAIAGGRVKDETTRRLKRVGDVCLALAVTYRPHSAVISPKIGDICNNCERIYDLATVDLLLTTVLSI